VRSHVRLPSRFYKESMDKKSQGAALLISLGKFGGKKDPTEAKTQSDAAKEAARGLLDAIKADDPEKVIESLSTLVDLISDEEGSEDKETEDAEDESKAS
jgi:hypothetical protein